MSFTIKVEISIVNEDGEIVNHKGYRIHRDELTAQKCELNMLTLDDIKIANTRMNFLFMVLAKMKDFIHGQ
ncbi:hypothetical protein [Aquabacterium sp.]|uniref:hypothetical protein n=1 Tax=Aquabacterium sp. TaxID=1872578 RepID=UPI0025C6742D|nr:hypothetical protein [Aquabacterium sp.]